MTWVRGLADLAQLALSVEPLQHGLIVYEAGQLLVLEPVQQRVHAGRQRHVVLVEEALHGGRVQDLLPVPDMRVMF